MKTLWRWFRFLLAICAALLVGGAAWVGWLLSGQRYQQLVVEQLSTLLGARVQVEKSHLSFHSGVGVQFDEVTVTDDANAAPFFTAAEVELLLDLDALWRGELLFRRIDLVAPRLQVAEQGKRLLQLVSRLREAHSSGSGASFSWLMQGVTPTLAVQELRLHDADIAYVRAPASASISLTETEAAFIFFPPEKPSLVVQTNLKHKSGSIGRISLRAAATKDINLEKLGQSEWTGELEMSGMQLQQLGNVWNEEWPSAKFDLTGRFQGKGEGPIEGSGSLSANGLRIGEVLLQEGRFRVSNARWTGKTSSLLRALAVEAQIEQLRGQVGKGASPLVVKGGEVTLREEELTVVKLSGAYGETSHFYDASVSLQKLSARGGPALDAWITADVGLEDDLPQLLTALTPTTSATAAQIVALPQGRALARLHVQRASGKSAPLYDGAITLQQAGVRFIPWNLDVHDLNGDLQINAETVSTNVLTFRLGQSWLKAQGRVQDVLSARRRADLSFSFTELRDYDLVPLLPSGKVLPQDGSVSGQLKVALAPGNDAPEIDGRLSLNHIRLDLVDFLHPFVVMDGELTLAGKGGSFTITQGQLPGGNFSGRGQIESWSPLRLELFGDFPDMDLASALTLDKPDDGLPKDATRDIRVSVTSHRLRYKGAQVENLRFVCHWHHRQADLDIAEAQVAGGGLKGDLILWPDTDAAYLAPQLDSVDVERFFQTVGVASKALSGSLSGEGKIFMPNWAQWNELAQWDAQVSVTVENGIAQRLPILVRLWSVLSMQGLLRLQLPSLPTEGLPFSSLTGDFAIGQGTAVTNNLVLIGSSVRIGARGQIDLAQRTLDLKTALAPLHGITSSVAKVPLAGELLARGADYLTTLNFRVYGPYGDPSVMPLLIDTGGR